MRRSMRGFTLIEVLVVIGIIAVLAGIVLVALNPGKQFADARNTDRMAAVETILNAIGQRVVDNRGIFGGSFEYGGSSYACPELTPGTEYAIKSAGGIDLGCLTPTYIPSRLPIDPSASGAHWTSRNDYDTGYRVTLEEGGRYTVSAPSAENGQEISLTR